MKESALRTKMIKRIQSSPLPNRARACHAGPHSGSVGEPDIDAVIGGISMKVEVKMPGNTPTVLQLKVIRDWQAAGAVAGWCDSMEGLEPFIAEAERRARLLELNEEVGR